MKRIKLILSLSVILFTLAGCNSSTKEEGTDKETYKVGVILPLTGPFAEYGIPLKQGMDLALSEINDNGGINGKKLELIIEDDKSTSKDAVNAENKLVNSDKVKLILGPLSSGNSLATAPISEKSKVVQISFLAGIPQFSQAGDYIFRIYPSSELGARFAAQAAIKKFNPKKIAIMYANNPFGEASKRIYTEVANVANIKVVSTETFLDGDKDFKTQLLKIKENKPDLILCSAYWAEGAIILKQMVEMNINMPIIGEDGWHGEIAKIVGAKGLNQLYFADILFGKDVTENLTMQNFIKNFESKYNKIANTASATGYQSLFMIKQIYENTSDDADSIKNYLYKTTFSGALGDIKYDSNGDNIGVSFALFKLDSLNIAYIVK